MTDIVQRLRRCIAGLELPVPVELAREVADEIERLRAALKLATETIGDYHDLPNRRPAARVTHTMSYDIDQEEAEECYRKRVALTEVLQNLLYLVLQALDKDEIRESLSLLDIKSLMNVESALAQCKEIRQRLKLWPKDP